VKSHAPQRKVQIIIIAKNKSNIIIWLINYIRDPVAEVPSGAADPPQAQSIRRRRFGYLQSMKSHAPHRTMQPKITQKNNAKINNVKTYISDPVLEAP
jgi:hypothetical protein